MSLIDSYGGPVHATEVEGLAVIGMAAEFALEASSADTTTTPYEPRQEHVRIGGEWVPKSTPDEIRREMLTWAEDEGITRNGKVIVFLANSDN